MMMEIFLWKDESRRSVRCQFTTIVDTSWRKIPLLIAKAPVDTDRFCMFYRGHVDSWYYGAIDNGTAMQHRWK